MREESRRTVPWGLYLTVIKAVFRRDLLVFLRYPGNAIFSIIDPFVWMLPVVFMARAFSTGGRAVGFQAYSGTSDFIAFWIVGGLVGQYVGSVAWGMGFSLKNEMSNGVIETNWLAPVPPVVILLGRSLWSLTLTTLYGIVGLSIAWAAFHFSFQGQVLPAVLALIPLLIGLYGFGFGLAAVVLLSNNANNIIDMANFFIQMLSGQQFPVQVLPRLLFGLSLAVPVTYGIDVIRGFVLGTRTLLPVNLEVTILLAVMIVFVSAGYLVFRRVERIVRTAGNLGFH